MLRRITVKPKCLLYTRGALNRFTASRVQYSDGAKKRNRIWNPLPYNSVLRSTNRYDNYRPRRFRAFAIAVRSIIIAGKTETRRRVEATVRVLQLVRSRKPRAY